MCNLPGHFSGKLTIPLFVLPAIVLMVVLVAQDVLAGQTFTVTNTNDSGPGSLRQAIVNANANSGLDIIVFNIRALGRQTGPGPQTIQPLTPLPHITDPVIIDGYTQPGAAPATDDTPATLLIELDGINVIGLHWDSGLTIHTRNSTVRGLVINRFGDVGIHIQENGGNIIEGNYIGTDVTGTLDRGNFQGGVRIWDAPNNTIGGTTPEARNVISGNNGYAVGILLPGATANKVQGNFIGTDVTGTADLGNSNHGVFIYEAASSNTIGPGNVIVGNGGAGIGIHGIGTTGNQILGNFIGIARNGTKPLGNFDHGVIIEEEASDNTIGPGNTISNNHYGIRLRSSSDNQIYNNNFIDNTTQAYATNGRRSNIFNLDKPIGGNYWSDWTTPDADGDGFVDYSYVLAGGVDNLPWARQDGWLPPPTLSEALDTDLSFTTGGDADWFSQTTTSYYRQDAAQSGNISHNQESWIQTTVRGAGTLKFYWKVSSEEDFDFLEFYIDGSLEDQISGSVDDWEQKTYTISTLDSHTLEWRYVKDKGTDSGSDCVWVDKVEWVPTPPPPPTLSEALDTDLSITTGGNADWFSQTTTSQYGEDAAQSGDISHNQESRMETTVNGPGTVTFYWKVSSEEDFDFLEFYIDGLLQEEVSGLEDDWEQETYTINTLGSHTLEWRYVKDKGTDSGSDCGWVDKLEWVPMPPPILSEALDTDLSFTTGGNADWFFQTTPSQYGGDAAQSGSITDDQESWLQTSVNGAGTVSFFWKVSSEGNYDCLEFYIDGTLQDQISGPKDWHDMTYEITGSSLHTLEWRYFKDGSMSGGDDCGWVDKVEWVTN